MSEDGVKYDNGKPRWGLLPWTELEDVVNVLTKGSVKYADENWKGVDDFENRYFDALQRHLVAYRQAKEHKDDSLKLDNESGYTHLAHVICNALFLMWYDNQNKHHVEGIKYYAEATLT